MFIHISNIFAAFQKVNNCNKRYVSYNVSLFAFLTVKALATLPLNTEPSFDEDDLSPIQPLPLFQQRENYFS